MKEGALDPSAVPLIDRQAEMRWLAEVADEVREASSGRLVTVVGSRGVGKSRVVGAFADSCRGRGMAVLAAQCVGRAAEPLLPIRDALRPVLGTNRRTVRTVLRRTAPELLGGVPVVGQFLAGLGRELASGPQIGGGDPRSLYDILAGVVVGLGGRKGLCLVIEDAHVADPDTLSFLTYLVNKSRDRAALIVVTLPSEEQQDPGIADHLSEWDERGGDSLTVRPFERPDVGAYMATVLARDSIAEADLDAMFSFTGGNPLLLGESVRELIERDGATVRLAGGTTEVPGRIRRLLERRLRRLDERTRSFVDVAAVVGETSHELLPILSLLGVDDRTGLTTLGLACDAAVLSESEDGRISFTSELFHMVTYAQLRPNQRRALHLHAGEWFEEQDQFSEAAHHYERAEDWPRMLPAALQAAEAAEHLGLYQAALGWYRRVQAHAEPAELFPRLARAMTVVGDWADAERVLNALPANDPQTQLLRSRLCFARGDVTGAADHARLALGTSAAADMDVLILLANIDLYSGEFARAAETADRALQTAQSSGSINDQACCHIVRGACLLYNGDPAAAEESFSNGIWLLDSRPPDERDVGVYSALLGNRGYVEEVTRRWTNAYGSHREALRMRQEVADAVGVLESTLAIGRAALGQGNLEPARHHLAEALRLAEDLGEGLQQAKVIHAMGELAARTGDSEAARRQVEDARSRFTKCGTPYDVAYADLSLASILSTTRRRESIERLASARAAVERKGFALLRRLFPELEPALGDRIHAGLLAYVAGDALGLPWEGRPPEDVRMEELDALPARELWPSGSTSDDTALTLLVAEHLAQAGGLGDPLQFLATLAARSGSIPGLGPSTKQAIEHFQTSGTPDDSGSNTNGAPMRALPVGWAVPAAADERRREWVLALTRMTHTGPDALTAACVMAAGATWMVEGAPPDLLVEIAVEEAVAVGRDTDVARALAALQDHRWAPPATGISLAPDETVAAVLHCCREAGGDLVGALRLAVSLGGDTDTVAALVGGLLGCRFDPAEVLSRLTWLDRVMLPPADDLSRLGQALAALRLAEGE